MLTQRHWFSLLLPLLAISLLPILVKGNADSDLDKLTERFTKWDQSSWPFVGQLVENRTEEVFAAHLAKIKEYDSNLSAIDRGQLDRQHQHSYDVLEHMLSTKMSNYHWRNYGPLNPVNFMEGFFIYLDYWLNGFKFNTMDDYRKFISSGEKKIAETKQMMIAMNNSITLGTTYHLKSVVDVPDIITGLTSASPAESKVYKPFKTKLDNLNITRSERYVLKRRGILLARKFRNALLRLRDYIKEVYIPNTRATFGVYGLPNGKDYYRACVNWHASYNTTPEEVHQTGLDEVERITKLMHQIMKNQNFKGTIREYYRKLENDPRFQMKTTEQITQGFTDLINNRVYPKLGKMFKDIPPHRPVVKPSSYDGMYAYYMWGSKDGSKPGTFVIRTIRPSDTKTFMMVSLTLHETAPGHHLEAEYAMASNVPSFRINFKGAYHNIPFQFPFFTSFSEGWGLYAEYLGEAMGVYQNEYEMMGRYADEMLRACRLVVDTGIHYYGWSRTRAKNYLYDRMSISLDQTETEVDRYSTWPGQALAYKLGELKIKELRKMAETKLGSKFDIREFHRHVITNGRMPLSVLEHIIKDYINNTLAENSAGSEEE